MSAAEAEKAVWNYEGLGPELKLFFLALLRTKGDIDEAARLSELKENQGRLFAGVLTRMGLAERVNGHVRPMPKGLSRSS